METLSSAFVLYLTARVRYHSRVCQTRPPTRTIARQFAMKMEAQGDTLRITGINELGAANSNIIRDQVRAALVATQRHIEIDLSTTAFVDSCGLGALIALHKTACSRNGSVRLMNPLPPVRQVLELTRLNRIFEISKG